MSSDDTIWELEPHTLAKHKILDRYLKAWFPIMSSIKKKIVYIDGFAGPGIYKGGEAGSPIIALTIAKEHVIKMDSDIIFFFIEKNSERCKTLCENVKQIDMPDNCKIIVRCESFESQLNEVFSRIEEQEKKLAPSFVFIDPFGYAQAPFYVIEKLMSYPKCEFLLTFMYDYINRFIGEADREEVFNNLFGTEDWKKIDDTHTPEERKSFIHDLYMRQLNSKANVSYIRSFEMMNKHNHTEYFLVFGTNHIKGLEMMKEAMWNVDNTGEYKFSDNTDPHQTVLFEIEPNYRQLKDSLINKFRGKIISMKTIEDYVIIHTPFLKKHLRKPILGPMEDAGEIEVSNRKRTGTYPPESIIKFI